MSSAAKIRVLRKRTKRYEVVHTWAISAACDRFFRSRGMTTGQRENFNRWDAPENQEVES
jgi:hypothetical protein